MPRRKQVIVTIHGVNTDGEWQERVAEVLQPHFECEPIKYPNFDNLFKTINVALDKWLFVLGLVLILLAVPGFFSRIGSLALAFVVFVCAALVSRRHRRAAIDRIKPVLEKACLRGLPPHLVAHSLGTFLSCNSLRKFPDLRYSRIVLVGSVLPRSFNWKELSLARGGGHAAFQSVRNEVGKKDLVVFLANLVSWIPKIGIGGSGLWGFRAHENLVHSADNPFGPCDICAKTPPEDVVPARIHNYPLREFRHSTHFLGRGHAEKLWLPYFWGIDPWELNDFFDLCLLASSLEDDMRWEELGLVQDELHDKFYKWHNGCSSPMRPLEDYVKDQIRIRYASSSLTPVQIGMMADRAVRLIWRSISDAYLEREKPLHEQVENVILALHPKIAIGRAVEGCGA